MGRRLLFFLACATAGAGLLILLSSGNGNGTPFGVAFCALLVTGGALGGRRGRGPVARGVAAPELTMAGLGGLLLCAVAAALLLWRPSTGDGLPVWPFLTCMAVSLLLMVIVGRMGDRQPH